MHRIFIGLLFFIPTLGPGQVGFSYPYFLSSPNGQFFLKSIPYKRQLFETEGMTEVYASTDSSMVYSISRYFVPGELLIGNDGKSMLHAKFDIYNDEDFHETILQHYHLGTPDKSYEIDQIVKRNPDDYRYSLLYRNWEASEWKDGKYVFDDSIPEFRRKLLESPFYTDGQHAFLATKDNELFQFDLNNGELISRQAIAESAKLVNFTYHAPLLIEADWNRPPDDIPSLYNGLSFLDAFEGEFDFKYDGVITNEKFKYYRLEMSCLVDTQGICLDAEANFEDAELNLKIEAFFESQRFDATSVPADAGKWYFEDVANFRKSDTLLAVKEKIEETKWRNKTDSIAGFYIPRNIEDCMTALDDMLALEEKNKLKGSFPLEFHHSLGTYLRTNWGLWQGSRLKKYFENLGITHPDDMSSFILDCYWLHLRNKPYDLEAQLEKYKYTRIHVPQFIMPDSATFQVK